MAAVGAAIGLAFVPLAPVSVPIGFLVGGVVGATAGAPSGAALAVRHRRRGTVELGPGMSECYGDGDLSDAVRLRARDDAELALPYQEEDPDTQLHGRRGKKGDARYDGEEGGDEEEDTTEKCFSEWSSPMHLSTPATTGSDSLLPTPTKAGRRKSITTTTSTTTKSKKLTMRRNSISDHQQKHSTDYYEGLHLKTKETKGYHTRTDNRGHPSRHQGSEEEESLDDPAERLMREMTAPLPYALQPGYRNESLIVPPEEEEEGQEGEEEEEEGQEGEEEEDYTRPPGPSTAGSTERRGNLVPVLPPLPPVHHLHHVQASCSSSSSPDSRWMAENSGMDEWEENGHPADNWERRRQQEHKDEEYARQLQRQFDLELKKSNSSAPKQHRSSHQEDKLSSTTLDDLWNEPLY